MAKRLRCKTGRKPKLSYNRILEAIKDSSDISDLSDEEDAADSSSFISQVIYSEVNESSEESELAPEDEHPCSPAGSSKRKLKSVPAIQWQQKPFEGQALPSDDVLPVNLDQIEIRSFLSYFSDYFNDDFFTNAVKYTNMYSEMETGQSMNTTRAELMRFVGIHLMMGCIPYPRLKMYWKKGISMTCIADCMSRDRFLQLRRFFHLVDTNNRPSEPNSNKLWMIQPMIDAVCRAVHAIPRDTKFYSIDEQMIPFLGRCPVKQYVKNKPRPEGLKNFVVATSSGLVVDFEIYQGDTTPLPDTSLGLGPAIVLRMVDTLPEGSFIYFDRYFTTIPLLKRLVEMKLNGTGTINANRVKGISWTKPKTMNRGDSVEHVTSDNKIVVVEWMDSNKVVVSSTCSGATPSSKVQRWSKKDKAFIEIDCPSAITQYNKHMGGVDLCDQQMECYRSFFKTPKWTWKTMAHFFEFAAVNAWFLYMHHCRIKSIADPKDLLTMRMELAEALMATEDPVRLVISDDEEDDQTSKPSTSRFISPPSKMPSVVKRYDKVDHFPTVDNLSASGYCRKEKCEGRSRVRCLKCNVYLCLSKKRNCFYEFHVR